MITDTVTKIHAARDVIGDNYIHGNGPSIEAIRFEKTRRPKESRLFFRIPGAVSSGAPSSSSLFPSGRRTTSGTRYTTRIDYVFLEWTRINERQRLSREFQRQRRRKGRIRRIACYWNDASKCCQVIRLMSGPRRGLIVVCKSQGGPLPAFV